MLTFDHALPVSVTAAVCVLLIISNNNNQLAVTGYWTEMELVSIENINVTDETPLNANLFIKRIKRDSFGISGNIWTTDQLRDYDAEIEILHSGRFSNNHYVNTPARYARKPMCEFFEDFYFKIIMEKMKPPVSDMPQVTDKSELCPLFINKNFTLEKFVLDPTPIPKIAQPGMYKAIIKVHRRDPDRMVSGIDFTLRLG